MPRFRTIVHLSCLAILAVPACLAAAQPKTDYEKGAAAFQKRDYFAAIDSFENALAKSPKNANVCYGLASAFSALGQNFQAIHFYEQCKELAPNSQIAENAQKGIDFLQQGASAPAPRKVPQSGPYFHRQASPHPSQGPIASSWHPQLPSLPMPAQAPPASPPMPAWMRLAMQAPPSPIPYPGASSQSYQPPGQPPQLPYPQQQPVSLKRGRRQQSYGGGTQQPAASGPFSFTNPQGGQQSGYGGGSGYGSGSGGSGYGAGGSGSGLGYGSGYGGGSTLGYGPRGGRHHHHQTSMPYQTAYNPPYYGGGGYSGYGHVPTLVVREYSFPKSFNAPKSEDSPFMVELLAKQEKLVIDAKPAERMPVDAIPKESTHTELPAELKPILEPSQ